MALQLKASPQCLGDGWRRGLRAAWERSANIARASRMASPGIASAFAGALCGSLKVRAPPREVLGLDVSPLLSIQMVYCLPAVPAGPRGGALGCSGFGGGAGRWGAAGALP